jgi:hypothetical protein
MAEMIMDVEVKRIPSRTTGGVARINIKMVAISGGCGPELNMPESIAISLYEKLKAALGSAVPELQD